MRLRSRPAAAGSGAAAVSSSLPATPHGLAPYVASARTGTVAAGWKRSRRGESTPAQSRLHAGLATCKPQERSPKRRRNSTEQPLGTVAQALPTPHRSALRTSGTAAGADKRRLQLQQAASRYADMWIASDKTLRGKFGAPGFQPTATDVSQLAAAYGVARCFPGNGSTRYAGVARYLADPGLATRLQNAVDNVKAVEGFVAFIHSEFGRYNIGGAIEDRTIVTVLPCVVHCCA